jgi:multidrug efflux pump subunit AcrB
MRPPGHIERNAIDDLASFLHKGMLALDVQDSEVWHSCLVLILHRRDRAFLHFLQFCDSQETDKFRPRNRGGFYAQTNDQLLTAEGFNNYILANRSGIFGTSGPVRVRDVGRAIVAAQDVNLAGWMNTEPAIIIAVQRHPGANVIATVDQIKKALPQLEASLPPSIKIHIVSDRTRRSGRASPTSRGRCY